MQYIWELLGNSFFAQFVSVVLPALIFASVHIYQGKKTVIKIMVMACLFGMIYLLTQSLWWLIILHILVDVIGGILAVWIMPETVNESSTS
jgi:membrane protease YdiL (CAAX protease family)